MSCSWQSRLGAALLAKQQECKPQVEATQLALCTLICSAPYTPTSGMQPLPLQHVCLSPQTPRQPYLCSHRSANEITVTQPDLRLIRCLNPTHALHIMGGRQLSNQDHCKHCSLKGPLLKPQFHERNSAAQHSKRYACHLTVLISTS